MMGGCLVVAAAIGLSVLLWLLVSATAAVISRSSRIVIGVDRVTAVLLLLLVGRWWWAVSGIRWSDRVQTVGRSSWWYAISWSFVVTSWTAVSRVTASVRRWWRWAVALIVIVVATRIRRWLLLLVITGITATAVALTVDSIQTTNGSQKNSYKLLPYQHNFSHKFQIQSSQRKTRKMKKLTIEAAAEMETLLQWDMAKMWMIQTLSLLLVLYRFLFSRRGYFIQRCK